MLAWGVRSEAVASLPSGDATAVLSLRYAPLVGIPIRGARAVCLAEKNEAGSRCSSDVPRRFYVLVGGEPVPAHLCAAHAAEFRAPEFTEAG